MYKLIQRLFLKFINTFLGKLWLDRLAKKKTQVAFDLINLIEKQHKDSLIMIFTPNDQIIGSYKGFSINTQISKQDGGRKRLLKRLMNATTTDRVIDNFLLIIDGLTWSLAKKVKEKRQAKINNLINQIYGKKESTPAGNPGSPAGSAEE